MLEPSQRDGTLDGERDTGASSCQRTSPRTRGALMRRAMTRLLTGAVVGAVVAVGLPGSAQAALDWGPIVTVHDHGFDNLTSLTTDNGTVIAAWTGPHFSNVFIAVRRIDSGWSTP